MASWTEERRKHPRRRATDEMRTLNATGLKGQLRGGYVCPCGHPDCGMHSAVFRAEDIGAETNEVVVLTSVPGDSASRKAVPVCSGVLDYFPAALVEVAKVSKAGNDKHNPGEPLHHARGKSTDHADALLRHLIDRGKVDGETGMRHSAEMAWRALALLQQELEDEGLAPLPRGARLSEKETT